MGGEVRPDRLLEEERRRREEAEDQLRQYIRQVRRVMDTLPEAFVQVDEHWRVVFLNRTTAEFAERLGFPPESGRGSLLWKLLDIPQDHPIRPILHAAAEAREVHTGEVFHEALDAWLEVRALPSAEPGISVFIADISDRREAERTLRETQERLRAIVENSPEAIVLMDPEADEVVEFNRRALELFRCDAREFRGGLPHRFSPERQPDGRRSDEAAREYLQQALSGESPVYEWVHRRGDGMRLDAEVRLARVSSGGRTLVQANIRDVTTRKQAEEALRESEERYRALFEQDVAGNFVTTADGTLLACNRAFARIFGFETVDDALGSDVNELHASAEQRRELLEQVQKHGKVEYHEMDARRIDGTPMHLVENVRGAFDEEGNLTELRGHVVDVTERRILEEQLQQAQRLEAIGRLAGGIAHDFNNLLTTVTGHTDLLLTDERVPAELHDDLRRIKRATRRAARLTAQLVAFSRKQVLKPVRLDLNRIVEEVAEMLRRIIGEDIHLDIKMQPDLWAVRADPSQIEQVLMNLALNSRDAMPRGGRIEIETRNVEFQAEEEDRPRELEPGRYVALTVRDTGHGISEDEMGKIFEPFYTTKGPGEGSGLGLAMVYGIVRQSEGDVLVESEPEQGTAFTVLLPEAAEGAGAAAADTASAPGDGYREREGGWTILLIQHDPVVRKLVRRILSRDGHSVLEAEDPGHALGFCRDWNAPIHAVVCDLLSDEDERDLRAALEESRPAARILWTCDDTPESPPTLGETEDLLQKPFSSEELNQRIRHLLARSTGDRRQREPEPGGAA